MFKSAIWLVRHGHLESVQQCIKVQWRCVFRIRLLSLNGHADKA